MEKKSLVTLISQGAAGGAISYFLLALELILSEPNFYNYMLFRLLPTMLAIGSVIGMLAGTLIWFAQMLLKRTPGFLMRSALILVSGFIVGTAGWLVFKQEAYESITWTQYVVDICLFVLPVGVLTGSRIKPLGLIVFGPSAGFPGKHYAQWLSLPAASLLRLAGAFGFMESLLVLAYWASSYVVAEWMGIDRPILFRRDDLTLIAVAVLYFAATVYASYAGPPRVLLVVLALTNGPLILWAFRDIRNSRYDFLTISAFIFIGLWIVLLADRVFSSKTLGHTPHEALREDL